MATPHYVRRHAPAPAETPNRHDVFPLAARVVGWVLFYGALATLVAVLYVAVGHAGDQPGPRVNVPTTYGAPATHEDQPGGVVR